MRPSQGSPNPVPAGIADLPARSQKTSSQVRVRSRSSRCTRPHRPNLDNGAAESPAPTSADGHRHRHRG
jgi:hypothetical protein